MVSKHKDRSWKATLVQVAQRGGQHEAGYMAWDSGLLKVAMSNRKTLTSWI